jgi:chlorobactene glucosyltransferase
MEGSYLSMWIYHGAVVALLAAVLLQLTINLRVLRRLSASNSPPVTGERAAVSLLIPARNEADRIGASVSAWIEQAPSPAELLVLDDESTDATAKRAREAVAGFPWARVLAGASKPPGWTGKSFACHQLAQAARGDLLVFADADVVPAPGALAALLAALEETGADAVTVLPRHTASSLIGRQILPLQSWALACFHPLWLAVRRPSSLLAAANGQLLAIPRPVYEAVGGHQSVGRSLAEDADLGRRLGAAGFRLIFVDGTGLVTCRIYDTLRQAWVANTKNLFALLFRSHLLAAAAILGLLLGWVAPWLWLAAGIIGWSAGLGLAALEVLLGLAGRAIVARRFGYRLADTWSHPLLVLLLSAMVANSIWIHGMGRVQWRGREYAPSAAGWGDVQPRDFPSALQH